MSAVDVSVGISAGLSANGITVRDRFQGESQVRALSICAEARRARGEFRAARIGADRTLQRHRQTRGDSICWLAEPLFTAERDLLAALEALRLALNREAILGLFDVEMHYAWYPPGACYARHVDQPQGRGQRRVSLVLYLNSDWVAEAGGELRVFDATGAGRELRVPDAAQAHCDIAPIGGRLVCFLTEGREHEVLPARRGRLSLSGWFRTRD
jgi:SM-20-related protein